ncbi:hypothetical protein D3C81_1761210 [compost metagenome]
MLNSLLFSFDINVEIGIQVVKGADDDIGIIGSEPEHQLVDVRFLRVRMGIDDQNHRLIPNKPGALLERKKLPGR